MGQLNSYRDLDVWKQSRLLVKSIYNLTKKFPKEEQFGLTNQLRRASISMPSNIAEGCGRNYSKDSIQFFFVARGSLYEIETQLILSSDLDFISEEEFKNIEEQVTKCKKILNGFINYYQSKMESNKSTMINEVLEKHETDKQ